MYKNTLSNAYSLLGRKLPTLTILMLFASIFEGVGLAMLMPLLSKFGFSNKTSTETDTFSVYFDNLLAWFNIPSSLESVLVLLIVILIIQVTFTLCAKILQARYTNLYTAKWRKSLFSKIIHSEWSYLQSTNVETQTNQIMNETSRNSAALGLLLQIINSSFFVLIYAIVAFITSWKVLVGLLIVGIVVYYITRPLSNRSRQIGFKVTAVSEKLIGQTQEFLLNAKLIKATATEEVATKVIDKSIEDYCQTYITAGILPAFVQAIYLWLGYILMGIAIWLAVVYLNISPIQIVVTLYVFLRLYNQLANIQQLRQSYLQSVPALENCQREHALSSKHTELNQEHIHPTLFRNDNPISLTAQNLDVSFGDKIALKNVSIDIPAGSILGLTGQSGAGKSTFVDVVAGLIKPNSGSVLLDDVPISEISSREWRKHIGYVAQETLIIKGSIAENISWGNPSATNGEIITAAKNANAHEFIMAMPEGYETIVGGRSIKMSGGQRQRIGLARALIGAKYLLILDEATSALDSESEKKVMEAVEAMRGKVTIIVVAHRLSTLMSSNQICVFENGKIVEIGNFNELVSGNGPFEKLWYMQSQTQQHPER